MSTLDNIEIPKPRNWQDFERLVDSYLRIRWSDCIITLFGGAGQAQHGVDIYVRSKNASLIGIQCKKVTKLTYAQIEQEVEKAKNFKPALEHFIIATSMNKSAQLQEKANTLNLNHYNTGLFSVDILFWEDITALIVTDEKVFAQHYPQLALYSGRLDSCTVHATNINDSVIGNNIIINTSKNPKVKKAPIQGTIGSDTYMKNYDSVSCYMYFSLNCLLINKANAFDGNL